MKKILVCLLTALIASGMFAATAPADTLPAIHVCKGKEKRPNYWYVGAGYSVPFMFGDMSSLTAKRDFWGNKLSLKGGYRFSSLFGLEMGVSAGRMRGFSPRSSEKFRLGTENAMTYYPYTILGGKDNYQPAPDNAGVWENQGNNIYIKSIPYSQIYSESCYWETSLQAVFNFNRLFTRIPEGREQPVSLLVKPGIYLQKFHAQACSLDGHDEVAPQQRPLSIGLGGDLALHFALTQELALELNSGLVWVSKREFDGIRTVRRSHDDFIWQNGVSLIWKFRRNASRPCRMTPMPDMLSGLAGETEVLPFSDGDFAFSYLTPDLSVRKERSISRQAHLYFVVSRWDIRPELGDNLEELGKITTAFRELADDEDISISSISIDGYASPGGPHDFNILHDGTSYEIPLLGINFKLNPGNLSLKDRNGLDSLLLFNREGQTMDVPYICSPNVERIEAMLPAGWSMWADISPTDSTKRIIHLTAPQLMDLDRSQFEGGATFIAFDQKGAAVTQFIKLKLKKYMYISFFYNPLNSVETNRPTSPLNSIGFSDRERLHLRLYSLEGKDLQLYGAFDAGNVARGQDPLESVLHQYPSLVFNKNEKDVEKMFKGVGAVFNSDSLDLQLKGGEDKPQSIRYCNPEWEPVNPRKWILKPVPHETYMAQFSFEMNNGSNNETMRLKRASAEWYIDVAKASELFGFKDNKDAFDYTKMVIRLSMQAVYLYSDFTATTSGYTEARPNTMSYDKEKDVLTCRFCTLGSTSSQFEVFFYYDGVGKKTFKTNLGRLVLPDMRMSLFLNQGVERQGYTYMNASLLYDAANERTTISETRYGLKDFDASQDLPFNP